MHNALGVAGRQRRAALRQDTDTLTNRNALATHPSREALAVEELHHDVLERHPINRGLTKVDDVDDVRMVDVIHSLGFVKEACDDGSGPASLPEAGITDENCRESLFSPRRLPLRRVRLSVSVAAHRFSITLRSAQGTDCVA